MADWDGGGNPYYERPSAIKKQKDPVMTMCPKCMHKWSIPLPIPEDNQNVYCSKVKAFVESENKTCVYGRPPCKDCEHAFIRAKKITIEQPRKPSRFEDII